MPLQRAPSSLSTEAPSVKLAFGLGEVTARPHIVGRCAALRWRGEGLQSSALTVAAPATRVQGTHHCGAEVRLGSTEPTGDKLRGPLARMLRLLRLRDCECLGASMREEPLQRVPAAAAIIGSSYRAAPAAAIGPFAIAALRVPPCPPASGFSAAT